MGTYRTVNLVLLGLLLYSVLFPLISPCMERVFPSVWRCHYRAVTGRRCFFCGLTGDLEAFLRGEGTDGAENVHFPLLLKLLAVELPVRILFTVLSFRRVGSILYRLDAAVHLAGFAVFFLLV